MPDPELLQATGVYFALGCDSFTLPEALSDNAYVMAMNITCKGGVPRTRPGSRSIVTYPKGRLQGCTLFNPASGIPQILAAVDGSIYVANYPFTSYALIPSLQFSSISPMIAWMPCQQSTDYDASGNLLTLDTPVPLLIIQDGNTRAAVWDGSTGRHLNPTISAKSPGYLPTSTNTVPGYDETPVGLWMVWSNNRLWVSCHNKIQASDMGNPIKFTETQYLAEARAFYIPDECTGMTESADQSGVWAFTATTGTFLQSSVQDRTLWENTLNFSSTILKSVGCVAPRSITKQWGELWWYSAKGLINMDAAVIMNQSSVINVRDLEMAAVKQNVSYDLGTIAACEWENILVQSVPNGDRFNTYTMVLDQVPFENATPAWSSYWTGWRPVEWCKGTLDGMERVFFVSADYDGNNRLWEANLESKTDNGVAIPCWLQTKDYLFSSRDWKKFKYAELELMDIFGDVSIGVAVGGLRGAYQTILSKEIKADIGQVYPDSEYGPEPGDHVFAGSKPQTRVIKTNDTPAPSECNNEPVESDSRAGFTDKAFSLLIMWAGDMALRAYRLFAYLDPQGYEGTCETQEESPRLLSDDGCAVLDVFCEEDPLPSFTASSTFSAVDPATALPVSYTANTQSSISQDDADRRARDAARVCVETQIGGVQ